MKKKYLTLLRKEKKNLLESFKRFMKKNKKDFKKAKAGDIVKFLKAKKFKKTDRGCSGNVYIGDKFVVKDNYMRPGKPPRRHVVPSIKFHLKYKIQPKCDLSDQADAYKTLSKTAGSNRWRDYQQDNCGKLDGKPVIFDW